MNLNLSLLKSVMAFDEAGGVVLHDHITDIDPCEYTCTYLDAFNVKMTYKVDGHLVECHTSCDYTCTQEPCQPTSGCWIWNMT